jgi:hypothetical protein
MDKPSRVKLAYQTIRIIAKESRPGEPGRLSIKTFELG